MKQAWKMAVLVLLAAMTTAILAVYGCSGEGEEPSSTPSDDAGDAGRDAYDGWPDARDAADGMAIPDGDADAGCIPYPVPIDVPKGWVEFTDWSCDCRFYVPGEGVMPDPIAWEPCPEPAPQNIDCRYMTPFWAQRTSWVMSTYLAYSNHPTLGPVLAFTRTNFRPEIASPTGLMTVIAQADGEVLNGFFQRHGVNDGCYHRVSSVNGDVFTLSVSGAFAHVWDQSMTGGVGGSLRGRPRVVRKHTDYAARSVYASDAWLVEWKGGSMTVMDWDASSPERIYPTEATAPSLPAMKTHYVANEVFFTVNADGNVGVMSWDPDAGVRPLLRWYDDPSRGAGDFGTDGVDMVWVEGDGKPPGGWYHEFENKQIRAAPFTTDPVVAQGQGRRLRSLPKEQAVTDPNEAFVVGCGLAAHTSRVPCRMTVIRLSDGYAWFVPCAEPLQDWYWHQTLGITCEEVFVLAGHQKEAFTPTIARVRLDSLGEPVAPE